MSTATKDHLRVQLLTLGLAAGQCSILNTLRAPSVAISCVTWGRDREQKLDRLKPVTPRKTSFLLLCCSWVAIVLKVAQTGYFASF